MVIVSHLKERKLIIFETINIKTLQDLKKKKNILKKNYNKKFLAKKK